MAHDKTAMLTGVASSAWLGAGGQMNTIEHLFLCAAEEGGEITQAAGKAGRFGAFDMPPGGGLPNNEYLVREVNDLLGVLEVLQEEGVPLPGIGDRAAIDAKKAKLRRFMEYAQERETLSA